MGNMTFNDSIYSQIKVKDYEINLQEKTDRLNELSIANEELERCLKEKDESNFMLTSHNKDLESQLNMTENKFKQDYEKVIDKALLLYTPFSHIIIIFLKPINL